jgi:2-dehydro-3-deoxyphosphogluconate aldolase / (4S)-4-hydroxy-2-oxoglutarate aldolase
VFELVGVVVGGQHRVVGDERRQVGISAVGPSFVRELRGPLPQVPLIPTGGVTVETAPAFIAAGAVAIGIGSWLTGGGDPAAIGERGRQLIEALRTARA